MNDTSLEAPILPFYKNDWYEVLDNQSITVRISPTRSFANPCCLVLSSGMLYAYISKNKRVVLSGAFLLSFLLSLTHADNDIGNNLIDDNSEISNAYEVDNEVFVDEREYDYEEVVGEETKHNIVPFHKYPGVYVLDLNGILYALDADNGEILWAHQVSEKLMKVKETNDIPRGYQTYGNSTSVQGIISFSF